MEKTKNKSISIAIDGPAGVGKSTIAKLLSEKLSITYIDTGAMYRAITYKLIKNNIDLKDINLIKMTIDKTSIDFKNGNIYLDGTIVNDYIRNDEVTLFVSQVSSNIDVREKLVSLQRKMAKDKSIIMDGRDIGTVVLPNADYKFYLYATVKIRAKRRYEQLNLIENNNYSLEEIEQNIEKRDFIDKNRTLSPLSIADDAISIDNSELSLEETLNLILNYIGDDSQCFIK